VRSGSVVFGLVFNPVANELFTGGVGVGLNSTAGRSPRTRAQPSPMG